MLNFDIETSLKRKRKDEYAASAVELRAISFPLIEHYGKFGMSPGEEYDERLDGLRVLERGDLESARRYRHCKKSKYGPQECQMMPFLSVIDSDMVFDDQSAHGFDDYFGIHNDEWLKLQYLGEATVCFLHFHYLR